MPRYEFENIETKEISVEWLSLSQREDFLKNNPHLRQVMTGFAIADPDRLNPSKKQPSQFKERMAQIKSMNPNSVIP